MSEQLQFPDNFLWGSSISSHQTEGDNVNDWSEWEKSEQRLEDLRKSGRLQRHGLDNFISKNAADHFRLYKEDYQLAKELGHNALRISLEWSRIEPEEGIFSEAALGQYQKMIRHLRELGIEPLVTLWHWTIPLWLRDQGGWANPETPRYFKRYVEKTASFLKDEVDFWITLNEPELYAGMSYFLGIWPPQKKNPYLYLRVIGNLIKAHKLAFEQLHIIKDNFKVGIATNNVYFEPYQGLFHNRAIVKLAHWWNNNYFLNRIKDKQDFIGLNYYFHNLLHWGKTKNQNKTTSDLAWELHPEGIYHVLQDLKKYQRPIYVTENGLADATDKKRAWFIANILKHVHQAIADGVDVKGYLHWSLLDNFEWDKGFEPRFGLVEVNYKTQQRKPRPAAHFYSEIIKKNHLSKEDLEKHASPPED